MSYDELSNSALNVSCLMKVRKEVANQEGVSTIVNVMKRFSRSGGVQCNGCLAIMSLVRSESEICQASLTAHLLAWQDVPLQSHRPCHAIRQIGIDLQLYISTSAFLSCFVRES